MSLHSCEKCWEIPCMCGYEYRKWSDKDVVELVEGILKHNPSETLFANLLKSLNRREITQIPLGVSEEIQNGCQHEVSSLQGSGHCIKCGMAIF